MLLPQDWLESDHLAHGYSEKRRCRLRPIFHASVSDVNGGIRGMAGVW